MEPESPRGPHQRFKWYVVSEALLDGPAFAAKYTASDGAERLAELWELANSEFAPDERLAPAGLTLEAHGDPTSPVMFVMFPAPERRNEAYSIAMIPIVTTPLAFRVFTLEKAVFPPTNDPLVFLIETTVSARRNFGPPDDDAANDPTRGKFVTAVLEICDGKRQPLSTSAIELVDPRPNLARSRADFVN
jgi:hypothetical protein